MATQVTGDEILNLPGYRQDDTTNTTKTNVRVCYGWGVISTGVNTSVSETVTFPVTFAQRPIVTISFGGDAASATTYGSGGANIKIAVAQADGITTTTFVARITSRDVTAWSTGNQVFYQWTAIGEV